MAGKTLIENTHDIGSTIQRRVSSAKKRANQFARQIEIADQYDYYYYGHYRDYDRIKNYDVNYDLFNGRLDTKMYEDPICFNLGNQEVNLDVEWLTHYPLISQVANALYGEQLARPFRPLAKDISASARTYKKRKTGQLIKELLTAEIINPLQTNIQTAYLRSNQITDLFQLTPEQQQQVQADIQRRVIAQTPEQIINFMQNDYQTPNQRLVQQLMDYLIVKDDIAAKQNEGFKHAICTGEEIYYVGERHGLPVFENINPKFFECGGSQNTEWYQHMTWARYEQWFTVSDIMQRHALALSNKNLKELERLVEPIGGLRDVGDPRYDKTVETMYVEMSNEHSAIHKKFKDINYKTREGSNRFKELYGAVIAKYGKDYGNSLYYYGVREAHITYRDKRPLWKITRIENGKKVNYYQAEHYEMQPMDIERKKIWVDEVWEVTKIGTTAADAIYTNIQPVPGQYKDISNPFRTDLSYYGKSYNVHMNNSDNVSIIDLGKTWQMEFDLTMANVKHDMATDIGQVALIPKELKPEEYTSQQWLDTMRNAKILEVETSRFGARLDASLLRTLNLGKTNDVTAKVGFLQFFASNLIRSMNFNDARLGAIGQYSTNDNIVQSQTASYNQTEGYFDTHRRIVEKALNAYMNRARILYKHRKDTELILDDVSRMLLKATPDFWNEAWSIYISTNSKDIAKMEEIRRNVMAFIQNGMSFDAILNLLQADTPSDIQDIVRKETKRQQEQQEREFQQIQQANQSKLQQEAAIEQAKLQQKEASQVRDLQSKERRADIQADQFRRQADVDNNKIPDSVQKEAMVQETRRIKQEQDLKIKELELQLKEKELELKERELEWKMRGGGN